jgi:predicted component of type VI protein secretion system
VNAQTHYDTLTVINGPEDGTEFALTQRSFAIGAEGQCAVNLRLDQLVRTLHARAEVISEGYRLRSTSGARLFVNGRPAGAIRSRVAKDGDILRVGGTDLVLTCGAEGLASRSRGLRRQSDAIWAIRASAAGIAAVARGTSRATAKTLGFVRGHLLFCGAIAVLIAYFTHPGFRALSNSVIARAGDLGLF